jgi:NTP pyrophosphatase (non-canonical NTP hydrolase)
MSNEEFGFNEYQLATADTALYPGAEEGTLDAVVYCTLGLAGEAGEIPNKIKKIIRDNGSEITDEVRYAVGAEIGDVLWYAARLADELGLSLEGIAENNLEKLASRRERGVIAGSGDNR